MALAASAVQLPDRYTVKRHIANGGMASVWAAEDTLLGRLVAVKLLAPHIAADADSRKRFTREARTAARVSDCLHVVTVYDIGEHDGRAFIVMELLAGGTLADRLRADEPIPHPAALRWLREAAIALDCAHDQGIIHRDVKPGNLLLDANGRLAVGDFGIARLADDSSLTRTGQIVGTAAYLSPEQAMGRPATDASDRYALGVVAFELLTGRKPFRGEVPAAQARQHVEAEPPAASEIDQSLSPAVDDVLRWALAKRPEERPDTARAFVDALEDALGEQAEPRFHRTAPTAVAGSAAAEDAADAHAGQAGPPTPLPKREPPPRRGRTPRPATVASDPEPPAADPPVRRGRSRRNLAPPVALAAVALVLGAVAAFAGLGGGDDDAGSGTRGSGGASAQQDEQPPSGQAEDEQPAARQAVPEPEPQQPAEPSGSGEQGDSGKGAAAADGRTPSQLNDAGYGRLRAGDAAGAIPLLEAADKAYEAQGDGADRTQWGYALFNLGEAYMAAGRPQDAVKAYERRLEVSPDDQRSKVKQALREARRAAGDQGS